MTPDSSAAEQVKSAEFLRAIFGSAWEDAAVCAFRGDPGASTSDPRADRSRWIAWRAGGARGISTHRADENAYFVVSLFHSDHADARAGRVTRRKMFFKSMHVVVVDDVADELDAASGRKVRAADVLSRLGEPTYRLMTSPRNEQWGYVLAQPIEHRNVAEALVDEMIQRGLTADGSDPGMRGVTRYVRLPFGINGKARWRAAHPPAGWKVRLTAWSPDRRFDAETIAAAWSIRLPDPADADPAQHSVALGGPWRGTFGAGRHGDTLDLDAPSRALLIEFSALHPPSADFGPEDVERPRDPAHDPLLAGLRRLGLARAAGRGEVVCEITCPFVHEHTRRADNGSAYLNGGGISCFHGHCAHRTRVDYAREVARRLRLRADDAEARRIADQLDRPKVARVVIRPRSMIMALSTLAREGAEKLKRAEKREGVRWYLCRDAADLIEMSDDPELWARGFLDRLARAGVTDAEATLTKARADARALLRAGLLRVRETDETGKQQATGAGSPHAGTFTRAVIHDDRTRRHDTT